MSNIKNFNFNNIDLRLSNSEFYDFYLGIDESYRTNYDCLISNECLVTHFDFNEPDTILSSDTKTIFSLTTWEDAINNGVYATTYGLTGIDNGVIPYVDTTGDTTNQLLVDLLTGSSLTIASGETRFFMNEVSGSTNYVDYPLEYQINTGSTGSYMDFKGGFYQGYYKLEGYDYEVLPNRVNKGIMFDFWLNKNDNLISGSSNTILNDLYPDNKGFFFYWGTRAENKFWNQFEGVNTGSTSGCTSGATEYCTIPKELNFDIVNDEGLILPLNPPLTTFNVISNEFLIYGRARGTSCGFNSNPNRLATVLASNVTGATPTITVTGVSSTITNTLNPFLIYGRSRGGKCRNSRPSDGYGRETVCSFTGDTEPIIELDKDYDIIDNSLGFRIKDDGSIGYRMLTLTSTCENNITTTGVSVVEEYSISGVVSDNSWEHISIRWVADAYYDGCELINGKRRNGRLLFYVNCKLKFIVKDFKEFIAKPLGDYKEKQIGVPYNISLGGGSQGLLESMTFDGQDPEDLNLKIQENFAGTFIGSISQFKIFGCDVNWCAIKSLCETNRYGDL
jgi:hypothetical protein